LSKTVQLSVNKVMFRITPKGNLFPLINFNKNKELEKMGIDSIAMPNVTGTMQLGIGKGTRLRVKFESEKNNFAPEILDVMKEAVRKPELPTTCPSCHMPLTDAEDGHIKCYNVFCAGQSRGMVYKMIKIIKINMPIDLITVFLDKYVIGESVNPIDNIQDFQLLFSQVKHKNTQARLGNWEKQHNSFGKDLWELELAIEQFLKSPELPTNCFWSICNFPDIAENELHEMCQIDPKKLLNLEIDIKKQNLSPKVERYLANNVVFIKFLHDFFEALGEKTWKI